MTHIPVKCKFQIYFCKKHMNFDLADLRAFLALADLGSFKAASAALHLSQSALSRRIDKLEDALGVTLFTRTTRKVELSTLGRSFMPKARNVLNELQDALLSLGDVAERISSEVTFACVPSAVAYFLPAVIEEYHRRYPGIRIRVIDESSSELLLNVARGEADFGLTYIGSQEADLEFEPLFEEPFVVACLNTHPLAGRKKLSWRELSEFDYISIAPGSGNRLLIDRALSHTDTKPRWFCEVCHVPALVSLVEAGLGLGVVPRLSMPPNGHSGLVSIALQDPCVTRTLGLIKRRGRALSTAAQLFYDLLIRSQQRHANAGKP